MLYDIVLRLATSYASPATGGRHLARLMPADLPGLQRLVAGHLALDPAPAEREDGRDFFGNATTAFAFRSAYGGFAATLRARVDRRPAAPPGLLPATPLSGLPAALAACRDLGPGAPAHFTAASPRVPVLPEITGYARRHLTQGMTAAEAVLAIGAALHADMRYDPKATDVDTPTLEAFRARHGVCQDFSHVMIAGLRGLGIPAGYVSGFLRTIPPPGKPRLEGADAMHAWVRAWCGPGTGWVEYDPTNAIPAGESHIVVGYGRDYFDVSPLKGVMRLSGRQRIKQSVDVIPLEPVPPA